MPYSTNKASPSDSRPYFLNQFEEGPQTWRFTSRAANCVSLSSDSSQIAREASSLAHSDVVQMSEIEPIRLEVTWPISHVFARRFLAPMGNTLAAITTFLGMSNLRAR